MKNNRGSNIAHVGISLIHVSLVFGHTSTRDTSGRKRRSAFLRLFALLEFFPDSSRPRKWLLRPLLRALDRCRDIAHSSRPGTSPPRPPPRAGGPTTARRPPTHPRASRRVSSPKTRFLFPATWMPRQQRTVCISRARRVRRRGAASGASRVSRACLARCPLRLRESDLFPAAPHRAFRAALPHLGKSKGVETRVSERATFLPR